MKKPIVSPITIATQTMPINSTMLSVPSPASTPPMITANSPGAMKPSAAAVSAAARNATSR